MKTLFVFLTAFLVFPIFLKAQTTSTNKGWEIGYYSFNNELGISHVSASNFYTELRFTSNSNDRPELSLILRKLVDLKDAAALKFSYGIGGSLSISGYDNKGYFKVPLYLVKQNIITKNLNLMLGAEVKTDFSFYRILPGVGLSFKL